MADKSILDGMKVEENAEFKALMAKLRGQNYLLTAQCPCCKEQLGLTKDGALVKVDATSGSKKFEDTIHTK